MRCIIIALILVPFLATAVVAGLAEDVQTAQNAVTARMAILGGIVDPTKTEKKETKRLQKVLDALARYLGLDDADDLARCYKAVKYILKSKTVDASCLDALEDIRDSLLAIGSEVRGEAEALLPTVIAGKEKKVQKNLDKGDDERADGLAKWATSPKKCIKDLVKSIAYYRKAVSKAQKYQDDPPPPSSDVFVYGTRLFNNTAGQIEITDITYAVWGTLGGQPYKFGGKASDTHPQLLPIAIASMGNYDFLPVMTALVNSDPARPTWVPGDIISTSYTIHTTAGDISSP